MATIEASQIRRDIKDILKGADLSQLSSKKVRRTLEEKYDTDLTDRKKEIDGMLMRLIDEVEEEKEETNGNGKEESEEEKSEEEKSDESDFEAPEDAGQVKRKAPQKKSPSKKAKKASDDEDDDLSDGELARKLQAEENNGGRSRRGGRAPPKAKKKEKSSGGGGGEKKKTGYGRPCALSPTLAEIMGTKEMARSDVVKKMWEIIKERNLQDPRNKQFMICDDQLQKLFGRKRVKTFGMMKYLKDHMFNPGELEDITC